VGFVRRAGVVVPSQRVPTDQAVVDDGYGLASSALARRAELDEMRTADEPFAARPGQLLPRRVQAGILVLFVAAQVGRGLGRGTRGTLGRGSEGR